MATMDSVIRPLESDTITPASIARRSARTALETRGKANRKTSEDSGNENRQSRAVLNLANLAKHDEHENHSVERLRNRRTDERQEKERRGLVRGVALLPSADGRRSCEAGSESAARSGETQAGNRARDNHCCITHCRFPSLLLKF